MSYSLVSLPYKPYTVTLFLAGAWCLYGFALIIYRLTLHPLSRFPGSKLAAATKWYEFYYDVVKSPGGQYSREVDQMHKKYGPIIRINPDEIHIKDPDYHQVLYAPNARRDKYEPAAMMTGTPLGTFGTVPHDLYRKRRAANSAFFSNRAIKSAQPMIWQEVELLCKNFSRQFVDNKALDICAVFLAYTADVLCNHMFEKSWGYLEDFEKAKQFKETIQGVAEGTPLGKQFPWVIGYILRMPIALVRPLLPELANALALHHRAKQLANDFLNNTDNKTWEPTGNSELPPSLFHALTRSSLPPQEITADRLYQETFNILGAGADTTAKTLSHALYYLVANPSCMKRLRSELSTVMPSSTSQPDLKVLEELPFLTAIIKETLRKHALLTSRLPLLAPDELKYGDWIIPARTPVSMTPYDILHDPAIYPNPEEFLPDRWLENGKIHNHLARYWVPFNRGPRMCQGVDLAWAEMYCAVAAAVMRFDFELFDTTYERDIKTERDCFVAEPSVESKGIRMKVVTVAPDVVVC